MKLNAEVVLPASSAEARLPVVLLHGTGANAQMWRQQVSLLSELGHTCYLLEFRGHGKTPEPGEPTDLEQHVDDVIETLDAIDLKGPCIFLGHSLGAMVCFGVEQKRKDLVKHILAVGFPVKVPRWVVQSFRLFLKGPQGLVKNSPLLRLLPWRERILVCTNPFSLREIAYRISEVDYTKTPIKPSCPVDFSSGQLDLLSTRRHLERVQSSLPGATLTIFKRAKHTCMDDHPELFNQWLKDRVSRA